VGTRNILCKYGPKKGRDGKKRYSYTKGDPFDLSAPTGQYVNATITLHKVVSGNYSTKPVDESEFDQ
jgi:hypothetical protein